MYTKWIRDEEKKKHDAEREEIAEGLEGKKGMLKWREVKTKNECTKRSVQMD